MADKVKINFCAPRELMSLPGIGRQLCDSIMDLREAKGNITLDDLVRVKYLQVTEQLVAKLDFEPYQVGPSTDTSTEDVYARIGQAINNSRLRGPPSQYQPPLTPSRQPPNMQAGSSDLQQGFSAYAGLTGPQGPSMQGTQPYPLGQMAFPLNAPAPYPWPQIGPFDPSIPPTWQQTGSFDPSFPTNAQVRQPSVRVKTEGDFQNFNRGGGVQGKTHSENRDRQQSRSDWLPKGLSFDPAKTTWEAFYLKFKSFAREKHWSSADCKSKLMYILEGKAAEYFASLHEREPDLPYYDVIERMEARFAFRELQETSQLAFLNCSQNREEKVEDWADRVLTLATKAYKSLPDEHIQKQAVLRFCHGCYDKKAGLHAANKMPTRMEEAIDCIKWFQYNQQIFQAKKGVSMVGEYQSFDIPESHAWATTLQDNRSRPRDRYMSYKGQRDTSSTSLAEQKDTAKSDKGLEDRVNSLEEMFRQVLLKLDKAPERRGGYSSRSPSPSRRDGSPMRCFQCNEEGHFKRDCPNRKRVSFSMPKKEAEDLNDSGSDH